ncbi:hypothetical protein SAMN04488542_13061 [Fontibacillus panacisegetis]|uniref:Uncharacterized protein n=1 Tax=Fontibacillus panacisegetis TaxID=670482 RepID=A0A1G7SJV1_9BACL|nr:hypothetical protein [Fontibacillus panacisegetis]SDG23268.1 hypothetical protein SAMN04488542_13061 [Fontibacillus panacisegetis]
MNEQLSRMERHAQERKTTKRRSRYKPADDTYTNSDSKDEPLIVPILESDSDSESEEEIKVEDLPTRKELFPSQRLKLTRWFFNSLLYIFIVIMGLLLWWAVQDSPWGKTQGF